MVLVLSVHGLCLKRLMTLTILKTSLLTDIGIQDKFKKYFKSLHCLPVNPTQYHHLHVYVSQKDEFLPEIGNIWEGTDPQGLGVRSDSEHSSGGMEGHRPDSLGVLQTTDWDKLRAGHLLVLNLINRDITMWLTFYKFVYALIIYR